jgi:hypothetical protein
VTIISLNQKRNGMINNTAAYSIHGVEQNSGGSSMIIVKNKDP